MIKMVVCDIDGTLIDETEVLSPTALEMSRWLRERGILFTVATGRVEYIAEGYVQKLGIDIPYISCNGATIVQGATVIQRSQIPLLHLRAMIEQADAQGLSVIYSMEGVEQVYRTTPWVVEQQQQFDRYHTAHRFIDSEWQTLQIDKLTIMDDSLAGCITSFDALCSQLPPQYGHTRYLDRAVEVVSCTATKASAMKTLAGLLGLQLSEILAVGDHQNDIEMIQSAGVGVAVGNATPQLKAVADYVAAGHNINGVFEAVKHHIH